ncbi:MAG: hypothetical protein AB7F50_09870 [Fimbriimonadaceae bacterium]
MRTAALCLALAPSFVLAQVPEVALFVEGTPTVSFREGSRPQLTWYDLDGRPSLVGLRMVLESGHRVYVAQRLQRIDTSGDPDGIDEYYIERRGSWRAGKQLLPFGRRNFVREYALAARLDTELLVDEVPISIAYCDAGPGRNRGVVLRIGRSLGASVAAGNHFGVQSTTLAQLRGLDSAPGQGGGYRLALGADVSVPYAGGLGTIEVVSFRDGERPRDEDLTASFVEIVWEGGFPIRIGWARNWTDPLDVYSVTMPFVLNQKTTIEPTMRYSGGRLTVFAATLRVKL